MTQRSSNSGMRGRGKKTTSSRPAFGDKKSNATNSDRKKKFSNSFSKEKSEGAKPFKKRPYKKTESKKVVKEDDGLVRLNKYIASTGLCSRREADVFIETGCITINGKIVTEMGARVSSEDDVRFNGEPLENKNKVYILLNKPKDYITTTDDPFSRKTVFELIRSATKERVFSVGRLDRMTTGVLLFTNDGELTQKLTHPKFNKKKIYQVELSKPLKGSDLKTILNGVTLEDGFIQPDDVSYTSPTDKTVVGIEIHSGRNRIVRRIFEHLGYTVKKLDRVYFAGLTKKNLPRGKWRHLTPKEISLLKRGAFE